MARACLTRATNRARRARGFTLAESLVASVVLAVAVVGVSSAMIAADQQTLVQEEDSTAVSLARQLMEEVIALPLALPGATTSAAGWPTVTDRNLYDTADDFDGYTDLISASVERARAVLSRPVTNSARPTVSASTAAANAALAAGQYRRSVAVAYPATAFGAAVVGGDLAFISVTVSGRHGTRVQLDRLVVRTTVTR